MQHTVQTFSEKHEYFGMKNKKNVCRQANAFQKRLILLQRQKRRPLKRQLVRTQQ